MKLNVCIAGATGWVGKPLCLAVSAAEDMSLVGAVSRRHLGHNLKEVLGNSDLDLTISGSVAEALATPTEVLVDYTKADVVKANVMTAIRKGVHGMIRPKFDRKSTCFLKIFLDYWARKILNPINCRQKHEAQLAASLDCSSLCVGGSHWIG